MTVPVFYITEKHYSIIIEQAQKNFPQESGGFLGGKNNYVLAILPTFNKHLYNKTDTYGIDQEDIMRSHEFFKKNDLGYLGVYHSHPKGVAWPSQADIQTGQQYHFIISLRDVHSPKLAAFEIINNDVHPIPIQVVTEDKMKQMVALDIPSKNNKEIDNTESESELMSRIQNMRESKQNTYPKMEPVEKEASDFSTLA